jgi:hypothetical protein
MTDRLRPVLDELVPGFEHDRGDWVAVVRDTGLAGGANRHTQMALQRRRRRIPSARLLFAAAAIVAIAAPLAAVATAQNWWPRDWWFFRAGGAPTPVTDVNVVKTGTWDGTAWQLVAYGSSTDGICFGISPADTARASGGGGALACGRIDGVPRTPESKPSTPVAMTYMASSSERLPAHIVGPVIETAEEVEVHLADGQVLRAATFEAPDELGSIRFYVARLPDMETPRTGGYGPPRSPIRKLIGFDKNGQIVACLTVPMPEEGVPLSACR